MTTSKTSFKLFILLISMISIDAMPINQLPENKDFIIAKRQAPSDYQCSSGPKFNSTLTRSTTAGIGPLYVDTASSVQCSGRITTVEMCFTVDHQSPAPFSIEVVVLRRQGSDFRIVESQELPANQIQERDDQSTTDETICQNITMTNTLMVSEGDFIGFVCRNAIRVAFAILPTQSGTLRSATIQPVFGMETIRDAQLQLASRADNEFPLLRAVIEGRNTEQPTTPTNNNCDGNDNGNDDDGGRIPELNTNNIYNTTFTSFVVATIVAIVIIFILILVICGMGMSMLKMKFKCLYNLCRCCCGKKKKNKGIIRKIIHV